MDCGLRLLYAVAGYHHRQHRSALDGQKPWGKPAAHAYGSGLVCAYGGGHAAGQRLAGGPGWRAQYLFQRHCVVYRRFAVLRPGQHSRSVSDVPGAAGCRRRDDGAGRAANGDENRSTRSVYGGDDLRHPARPGWTAARPGAWRGTGRICLLALDFLD